MAKFYGISLIFVIFLSLNVVAQFPILEPESTEFKTAAITIAHPLYTYYQKDKQTIFNFDILNSSFAKLNNVQANCSFYFFNHVGDILANDSLQYNSSTKLWFYQISNSNITAEDDYSFYVHCFSSDNERGFLMQAFETTAIGVQPKNVTFLGFIILIPLFIAIFLVYISRLIDNPKLYPLRMFLILIGFVFVFESYRLSIIIINKFIGSTSLIDAIGDDIYIYGWVYIIVLLILIITFLYDLFMWIWNKRHRKTGDYGD